VVYLLGGNYIQTGNVDVSNSLLAGAVTTLTAGYLKGLSQVKGIQPYRLNRLPYYLGYGGLVCLDSSCGQTLRSKCDK
jgi:hypothetical protein